MPWNGGSDRLGHRHCDRRIRCTRNLRNRCRPKWQRMGRFLRKPRLVQIQRTNRCPSRLPNRRKRTWRCHRRQRECVGGLFKRCCWKQRSPRLVYQRRCWHDHQLHRRRTSYHRDRRRLKRLHMGQLLQRRSRLQTQHLKRCQSGGLSDLRRRRNQTLLLFRPGCVCLFLYFCDTIQPLHILGYDGLYAVCYRSSFFGNHPPSP